MKMMIVRTMLVAALLVAVPALAGQGTEAVDGSAAAVSSVEGAGGAEGIETGEIRAIIEYLGSDLLEGRAPGTRGGALAEEYIRSLFQMFGIEPLPLELFEGPAAGAREAMDGYYQPFTLNGFRTESLSAEAEGVKLTYLDDIVGSFVQGGGPFSIEGEAVFAGFGIRSDAWSWDDYKDSRLEGRVVIVRVNEPGRDSGLFEGDALTYYGRWTYKIEEAARRGAKAILLVHTTDSAGYGWHVVRNSWSGEELYLDDDLGGPLAFRGWIREEKLREMLERSGRSLDELYEASESRDFQPVDLGFEMSIEGSTVSRSFETRNVAGYIPAGSGDTGKAVVLSAHIDHLGMDETLNGDGIYNGAIDNGSAVAAMMIAARHLAEAREGLAYPVIVLACEAEEAGLLGSRYFAGGLDPTKIIANINFESTPVWESSRDFFGLGAEYSTLEDLLMEVLLGEGLAYSQFSMSDRGFFYRSDQFSFARRGIPSTWISAGEDFTGGVNRIREFFDGDYHTVRDEPDPGWSLESTEQTVRVAVKLVELINRRGGDLKWKGRMTFPVE